jgi:hypothetical protein
MATSWREGEAGLVLFSGQECLDASANSSLTQKRRGGSSALGDFQELEHRHPLYSSMGDMAR